MNRISTATRWLVLSATAAILPIAGCQQPNPEPTVKMPFDDRRLDRKETPVDPEWRQWAMENYRGVLLADLKAAPDVRFGADPVISASRNSVTGEIELSVSGWLDANTVTRDRYRRPYQVAWKRVGGTWELVLCRIARGTPAPDPIAMRTTTRPTTWPAAGSTPAVPANPADPGGVPAVPTPR